MDETTTETTTVEEPTTTETTTVDEATTTESTTETTTLSVEDVRPEGAAAASPAVEEPANDPTTNDTAQTFEERAAQARSDAMTNHAAEHGTGAGEQSNTEEIVS